jgi:hypothetical protein
MIGSDRNLMPTRAQTRAVGVMAVLALAWLSAGQAAAQSRTLGSPLSQPPNLGFGCEAKPTFTSQSYNGDYFLLPSGQPDCTWFQSGVIGSVDYNDPRTGSVPADGTITNVAVRSGPNPAPIRIVILRQIGGLAGGGPTTACCGFQSETAPLQPLPNTVTSFAVNVPVERNVRGTSAVADYVGISAASGQGTLPLLDTGDNNVLTGYTAGSPDAGFFYPRMGALEGPGGGTRNNESIPNVEVLLQWTWTPAGGVPTGPAAVIPGFARAAQVAAGRALIRLICAGNAACEGQLRILTGAAKAAKPRTIGSAAYSVAAGAEKTLKVKLNRRGRALMRNKKKAKVTLELTPNGGAAVGKKLTLKRRAH